MRHSLLILISSLSIFSGAFAQNTVNKNKGPLDLTNVTCRAEEFEGPQGGSGSITITSQLTEKPQVISKSTWRANLNFKIGRGYVGGDFEKPDANKVCENKLKQESGIFVFEYSCSYISSSMEFAKSSVVVLGNGTGQLCKNQSRIPGMNECWNLSNCH